MGWGWGLKNSTQVYCLALGDRSEGRLSGFGIRLKHCARGSWARSTFGAAWRPRFWGGLGGSWGSATEDVGEGAVGALSSSCMCFSPTVDGIQVSFFRLFFFGRQAFFFFGRPLPLPILRLLQEADGEREVRLVGKGPTGPGPEPPRSQPDWGDEGGGGEALLSRDTDRRSSAALAREPGSQRAS